jgi:hypothetical protein
MAMELCILEIGGTEDSIVARNVYTLNPSLILYICHTRFISNYCIKLDLRLQHVSAIYCNHSQGATLS